MFEFKCYIEKLIFGLLVVLDCICKMETLSELYIKIGTRT